jgi:hypothetical protein
MPGLDYGCSLPADDADCANKAQEGSVFFEVEEKAQKEAKR